MSDGYQLCFISLKHNFTKSPQLAALFITVSLLCNDCTVPQLGPSLWNALFPVNIFGFCKRLKGNVWQRLKNDGYENHL